MMHVLRLTKWITALLLASGLFGLMSLASAQAPPVAGRAAPAADEFFETKIRPILIARCYSCHSAQSKPVQGGLKLDSRADLIDGGAHGPALVPGVPKKSALLRAVAYTDKSLRMPPAGKLPETEIAALTAWVKMGAPWPADQAQAQGDRLPGKPAEGRRAARSFWAFTPPKAPRLPTVKNAVWAKNPIDHLILAGLEAKGLHPAPVADRRTLIRRATYDLTGLPPTPQEVRDFLNDHQPGAYARVIDRLLGSPAYGERWGRHWLDTARYADSNGLDENLVFTQAWRYRDYVVRAFNQDKPIDRFFQEQIAGDLLPSAATGDADYDRLIATGYLSIGPKMLAEDDPVKQELDVIDEQIDTLGKTFMGVTLGCARCHDHKFDPFPQTDYYALAGIFKSTRTMLNYKNMAEWQEVPLATKAEAERVAQIQQQIDTRRKDMEKRRNAAGDALLAEAQRRAPQYLRAAREFLRSAAAASTPLRPLLIPTPEHQNAQSPDLPLPPGAQLVEAEDFARGNVLKDRDNFGKGIGVLVNAGQYPNFTEYEINAPEAGAYRLDLRYASGDARPIRIAINGKLMTATAAGNVTGGFYPQHQQWFAEGVFALQAGKNVIRFERDSYFPHIDKFLVAPAKEQPLTRTPEQLAAEAGLLPDFLAQATDLLKEAGSAPPPNLKFSLPDNPDRLFAADIQANLKRLEAEIKMLQESKPMLPRAMAVTDGKPTNLRVHLRGNYLTLGKECPRRFPVVLAGEQQPPIDPAGSGRLELARWMTRPDHPLTARVFVNRVWRWHFGRGIVGTTDNFGALGDRPTNQPLLDWLATTFVADNWSLKKLHRRIMLSNTYMMGSRYDAKAAQADPENRLHWRMDRRRLEAEEVRDAVLAVGGTLDRTLGGSLLKFGDRQYVTSTANSDPVNYSSNRRSLYLPVIRSALYDVYTAFDFGDPTVMSGDRPTTTVAPQALFMMNSPLVLEQTLALATSLLAHRDLSDSGRVQLAYETCYARPATGAEVQRALAFVARIEPTYASAEPDAGKRHVRAWQSLCKALLAANEFIYVE